MSNTWIVTSTHQVSALVEAAKKVGGTTTVVAVGPDAAGIGGVDAVVTVAVPTGTPVEALAPAAAAAVAASEGDIVLVPNRPADRVLAGAVAVALGLPVVTGTKGYVDGEVLVGRFGGISVERVRPGKGLVVVMDGGAAAEGAAPAASEAPGAGAYAVTVVSEKAADVEQVNLGAAKRVVAAGRGFKAEADLQLARDLAAALGAELACSRPLAEGADWMAKDTYIGVSGAHIHPQVYVALGISGQLQHMSGCQDSRTIVAVNTDAAAPVFAHTDYGIVGDLYTVVPALTRALG